MTNLKYLVVIVFLITTISISEGCKKRKIDVESEVSKLPPISQNGSNTFGCIVNGKAWIPKSFDRQPNFFIIIDPTFQDGNFDLRTYRIENNKSERINIFSNNIRQTGSFAISSTGNVFIDFKSEFSNCQFLHSASNFSSGFLKVTKYNLQERIVAGEFNFNLYDKAISCDTIKITNGRFDFKL